MIRYVLILIVLGLSSFHAKADSCTVDTDEDFTVQFQFEDINDATRYSFLGFSFAIEGDTRFWGWLADINYQYLKFSFSDTRSYLWKTDGNAFGYSLFSEEPLDDATYEAKIEYDESENNLHYYRRSLGSSDWGSSSSVSYSFDESSATVESGTSYTSSTDGISNLTCRSSGEDYSENATYEFGTKICTGGEDAECTINFSKDYTIQPLVFVMPTIEDSNEDIPATLSIVETSLTSATIKQNVPNSVSGTSQPIQQVSYLVIEPGVANFNGTTVVAGYIDTDEYQSQSGSSGSEGVDFSDFGLDAISGTPVVLAQLQSDNNSSQWKTAGIESVGSQGFNTFLELSWSRSGSSYQDERIAYIAAPVSSGTIDGIDFQFGRGATSSTTGASSTPVTSACDNYISTSIAEVAGILGNKQQRSGSHGGWLRRCNIEDNKVSFVVDEDITDANRTHINESVGYFAYSYSDADALNIDLCPYFPQPTQSWDTENSTKLDLKSAKTGSVTYDYHIGGWSEEYTDSNLSGGNLSIGFDEVTGDGATSSRYSTSCDVGRCVAGGGKAAQPPEISPHFPDDGDLDLGSWNFESECPSDDSGTYCRSEVIDGDMVITIKSNLKTLKVQGGSASNKMIVRFEAGSGTYGRMIGEYVTNNHVITEFLNAGIYTFNSMTFNTNTELETGSGIVWLINDKVEFKNQVEYRNTATTDDFKIFAPNDGSQVIVNNIGNPIYGLILADKVEFTNAFTLYGAITSNELIMNNKNSTIVGESECFTPSPTEDLYLEITDEKKFALLCEDPEFTFTVRDAGDDNKVATDYSGTIEVELSDGLEVEEVVTGSGSNGSYTPVDGVLVLKFTASSYGSYSIKGELSTDATKDDSSELYVAPYKFDTDTVSAIAGRDTSFSIDVLACDDDDYVPKLVEDYDGSKSLDVTSLIHEQPTEAQGGIWGALTVAGTTINTSSSSNSVNLSFSSGSSSNNLNYEESGAISFILSDPDFECPEGFTCETDSGEWNSLEGVVNVETRPWTFAICDPAELTGSTVDMDGTATGGNGYIAAGDSFELSVLPIRYQSGGATSGSVSVGSSYCDTNLVTKNFFNSSSPSSQVTLLGELSTPSNGSAGDTVLVNDGYSQSNEEGVDNTLEFASLSWDEVGSLEIGASASASYFDMTINRGYREVGRFYPSYLSIEEHNWDYADGHTNFAYMSQPIEHSFIVEAKNSAGSSVSNYDLFASSLIVDIDYYAVSGSTDLIGRIAGTDNDGRSMSDTWSGSAWRSETELDPTTTSQLSIVSTNFEFVKDTVSGTSEYTTSPDGPYDDDNSELGLEVTNRTVDVVSFTNDRVNPQDVSVFTNLPDFRYGRMTLSDVGGNINTQISVPLKTEYWDGNGFVTSSLDSGSEFDTGDYCRETLWRDESGSSNASFASGASDSNVVSGEFSDLTATHDGSSREQVRLWLRQQSDEPVEDVGSIDCFSSGSVIDQPWLRYNWRNLGDEDPSSVVVFGIYRGNDRVIFRGETRLTGN